MLPSKDIGVVRTWAAERIPPDLRDQLRIEVDESHHSLTLYECRPPWREDFGAEWSRVGFARLTFTSVGDEWFLECIDGHGGFRPYAYSDPTPNVGELLAAIDNDALGVFWG